MSHLFISYSREDYESVERLITDLQAHNLPIYIDQIGLKPGTFDWEQALRDAIRDARAVILVASPSSRRSQYVRDEIAIARMQGKPIYPAWVAGEAWMDSVPMGLGHVQFVDMRDESYSTGLEKLAASLKTDEILKTGEIQLPPIPDAPPRNPYKGLRAFREADRQDFFGRDALVEDLIEAVKPQANKLRFLSVIGPSGSGKSSVVMAGLLPALHDGAVPGSDKWLYLESFVPGTHPLENLTITLARAIPDKSQKAIREDLDAPSKRGLHLLGKQIAPADGYVVLYIDQFEELYTLTIDSTERQQFIDLLTTAATETDGPVIIILSLRADFYDRPMSDATLGTLLKDHHEAVLPLTLADLYDVVQKPAELPDVRLTFEDGLVPELVFAVREQVGALPLLQFTLDQLFERREDRLMSRDAYEELGGVHGALAHHAEATFENLPTPAHRRMAQALFLRLIEPGATEQDTTRRRATMSELTLPDAEQSRILQATAQAFIEARLLVSDWQNDSVTVEVSHEALIREWERLGEWLHNAREDLHLQGQISSDVAEWRRRGQPADMLYRGTVLEDALAWSKRGVASADEMAFLAASQSAQDERLAEQIRIARRVRNFQRVTGVLLVVFGLAVAATIIAFRQGQDAQQERDAASEREAEAQTQVAGADVKLTEVAEAVEDGENRLASLRLVRHAEDAYDNGDTMLGLSLALEANRMLNPPLEAQRVLADMAYAPGPRRRLAGHTNWVTSVTFSSDGQTILSGSLDGTLVLWDVATWEPVRQLAGHTSWVTSVVLSSDGQTALSASLDGTLILWNVTAGKQLRQFVGHNDAVASGAFHPDGQTALSGACGNRDEDSKCVAGKLILWDVRTGKQLRQFEGHTDVIWSVVFSPDGQTALSASLDGTLILWDVATGEQLRQFEEHTDAVASVAFSPDGQAALSGSDDGALILWDVATGEPVRQFTGHTDAVLSVTFSSDGQTALSGSDDDNLILWDVATGEQLRQFRGYSGSAFNMVFSPDGQIALYGSCGIRDADTGCIEGELILWDVTAGEQLRQFVGHNDAVLSLTFSSDGQTALSGSDDDTLILWDVATGEQLRQLTGHVHALLSVAFSPDGQTALSGSLPNDTLILWDVATGEQLRQFPGHTHRIRSVAFSPNGQTALSGSCADSGDFSWCVQGELILWDIVTGERLREFVGHTSWVNSVVFSPDGQTALSGSDDNTLILWDVATGEQLRQFEGHNDPVQSVAFSPDGQTALSGSCAERDEDINCVEGELILWDVATGEQLRQFEGHNDAVRSVTFSPDGQSALSGSDDGTLILWRIDGIEQLTNWTLANRAVRPLTCEQRDTYRVEPYCVNGTPQATPTFLPTQTFISTLPVWTPITSPTSTSTPIEIGQARLGENRGNIEIGGAQTWIYEGITGDSISILVEADKPAGAASDIERQELGLLDTYLVLRDSAGNILGEADDQEGVPATFPHRTNSRYSLNFTSDGVVQIEVRSWDNRTGGGYTLVITRNTATQTPTATPEAAPSATLSFKIG